MTSNLKIPEFWMSYAGTASMRVPLPNFRDIAMRPGARGVCIGESESDLCLSATCASKDEGSGHSASTFVVRQNVLYRVSNAQRYDAKSMANFLAGLRRKLGVVSGAASPCDAVMVDLRHFTEMKEDRKTLLVPCEATAVPDAGDMVELRVLPFPFEFPIGLAIVHNGFSLVKHIVGSLAGGVKAALRASMEAIFLTLRPGGLRSYYCIQLEFNSGKIFKVLQAITILLEKNLRSEEWVAKEGEVGSLSHGSRTDSTHNMEAELEYQANTIILLHCTQGKDRTGIICALVQLVLGVPDDEVLKSYADSCAFIAAEDHLGPKLEQMMGCLPPKTRQIFVRGSPPSVLRTALKYLDHFYGGWEGYLNRIGYHSQWRNRLRRGLLVGYPDAKGSKD